MEPKRRAFMILVVAAVFILVLVHVSIYGGLSVKPSFAVISNRPIDKMVYVENINLVDDVTKNRATFRSDIEKTNMSTEGLFNTTSIYQSTTMFEYTGDINTVHNVAKDGIVFRREIYANNENPKTSFSTKLVYKTTKRVHDKLYGRPRNKACQKQFPTCILLGVYKCGTRELMDFLSVHPNVQIKNNPYEFGFFMSKKYKDGLNWFRERMPCVYDDQVSMMKHAGYFAHPQVPGRLYNFNKDIKMIVIVREPVQRFISHVWFRYKKLSIQELNEKIEKTLNLTKEVRNGNVKNKLFKRLLKYSLYDEPLTRFLKYFRKDQILVLESEEFKHNPASVLNKIESFLNLPRQIDKDMFIYNAQKKYYCVKSLTGDQVCYDNIRGRDYKEEINNATKQKLTDYFRPHNKRFFNLIGQRFDHWG